MTPDPPYVGSTFNITVTGFQPNENINATESVQGGGSGTSTVTADSSGTWAVSPTNPIPASLAGSVLHYGFTGVTSGATCTLDFTIQATAPTLPPPATTPATGITPSTAAATLVVTTPRFTG